VFLLDWVKKAGMQLIAGCQLFSPVEKKLTTSSNCSGIQGHEVILEVQLSIKAGLTTTTKMLTSPQLHP